MLDLKPRLVKPAFGSVEVNRAHPLSRALLFCALLNEGGGPPLELVGKQWATNSATPPAWVIGALGPGLKDTSENSAIWVDLNLSIAPQNTYSLFALSKIITADAGTVNTVIDDDDGGANRKYQLRMSNTVSAQAEFVFFDTVPNPYNATGATILTPGKDYAIGATLTTAKVGTVYLNGVKDASVTGANTMATPTNTARLLSFKGGTFGPNTLIYVVYGWNRELSASEMLWISKEPYVFLLRVPAVRYFFVKTPAAAGGVGPTFDHFYRNMRGWG